MGSFVERVSPGAFKRSLNNPDLRVVFLLNHEGLPLASTSRGSLLLEERGDIGLYFTALLDDEDPRVPEVKSVVRNSGGDNSFTFKCEVDDWSAREDGTQHRDIKSALIHGGDVSFVTYGANPSTGDGISISERSGASLAERREMLKGVWERRRCPGAAVDLSELRRSAESEATCARCGGSGFITIRCGTCAKDTEPEGSEIGTHALTDPLYTPSMPTGWVAIKERAAAMVSEIRDGDREREDAERIRKEETRRRRQAGAQQSSAGDWDCFL